MKKVESGIFTVDIVHSICSPKMKQLCFTVTPHCHLMQPTCQILVIGNKLPMISNNKAHTYTLLYSTMITSLFIAHSQAEPQTVKPFLVTSSQQGYQQQYVDCKSGSKYFFYEALIEMRDNTSTDN